MKNAKREQAFTIYQSHQGRITNRALAGKSGVSARTIGRWKKEGRWDEALHKNAESGGKNNPGEGDELNERQRLFCLYYVKSFNATQSAIKAGYSPESAHVTGSRLLKNGKVAKEISRMKKEMVNKVFVEAMDVLQVYVKIAFADITDYVTFGKKRFRPSENQGRSLTKMIIRLCRKSATLTLKIRTFWTEPSSQKQNSEKRALQ